MIVLIKSSNETENNNYYRSGRILKSLDRQNTKRYFIFYGIQQFFSISIIRSNGSVIIVNLTNSNQSKSCSSTSVSIYFIKTHGFVDDVSGAWVIVNKDKFNEIYQNKTTGLKEKKKLSRFNTIDRNTCRTIQILFWHNVETVVSSVCGEQCLFSECSNQ